MSVVRSDLFFVMKRFPKRKAAVQHRYCQSETFQNVCEDYRRCLEALDYWNNSGNDEASVRLKEYRKILRELELEILQNLEENL